LPAFFGTAEGLLPEFLEMLTTTTVFAKSGEVRGDWFLVDASGKTLGRLCSQIAHRLKGKHKVDYSPHVDMGDHIVVVNAEKIRVTGRKLYV
jgi:large subunit ribosomal protein L13